VCVCVCACECICAHTYINTCTCAGGTFKSRDFIISASGITSTPLVNGVSDSTVFMASQVCV
jgi:hypothetical protein